MDNIYDVLKRYEFNKTEPETLQKLVTKAIDRGNTARSDLEALSKAAKRLANDLSNAGIILSRTVPARVSDLPPLVGIDGSFQKAGGFGGKWYIPVSCAIVKALEGNTTKIEVEVEADIEVIQQAEFQNVHTSAERLMLSVETKALNNYARKASPSSYIFLDGPIIDPPAEKDSEYINLRCAALRTCLGGNIRLLGCVKRPLDVAFKKRAAEALRQKSPELISLMAQFPSDVHLLAFALSYLAKERGPSRLLYTQPFPIEKNPVTKMYLDAGLRVYFCYLQRDLASSVLRLEFLVPESVPEDQVPGFCEPMLDLCVETTYPGHHLPIVVQLAHEKCNIRQGCAEVLYEEIMTRARASGPLQQIVLSKLR